MGAPFTEDTTTQVVIAHGALVLLKQIDTPHPAHL